MMTHRCKRDCTRFKPALICIITFLLISVFKSTAAQQTTYLSFDPQQLVLEINQEAELNLTVADAQELYGLEVHLSFDPEVLEIQDADPNQDGVQVTTGELLESGFWALNQVDNKLGKIDCAVTLLNPAPAISGSGSIATISLRAVASGTTQIKIESAILATRDAVTIPVNWQDGEIQVAPIGGVIQQPPLIVATSATGMEPIAQEQPAQVDVWLMLSAGLGIVLFIAALLIFIVVLRKKQ